ncbi:MAG: C39 family peptidase, partial [Lysinibacillus sp.]
SQGITIGQNRQFEGQDVNKFFGSGNHLKRSQAALFLYRMHNEELEGATGIAVEAYENKESLTLTALATKGAGMLDESLRVSEVAPPKKETGAPAVEVDRAYIPVENVMQKPELPNGCEIVSLTAVLNHYGYNVSKTTMADTHLPKQAFSWKNGKRYGPDPYKAYAGNPRSASSGWYSFAPPIVKAAENYMATQQNKMKAKDISGSSEKEILAYLNKGVPVVVWVTLDLSKPVLNGHWYLSDTGKYYRAYTNLHAVVLKGYKDGIVSVMNPLKGQVTHKQNAFFKSYEELGKHALVLEN